MMNEEELENQKVLIESAISFGRQEAGKQARDIISHLLPGTLNRAESAGRSIGFWYGFAAGCAAATAMAIVVVLMA